MIPYNPADSKKADLLDEGEYSAIVENVTPKLSKAAAARGETATNMLEIVLRVDRLRVWDYVTVPAGVWKLEQIAAALGESDAFAAGTFDLETKCGATIGVYLRLKTDSFGSKMSVGEYKPAHRAIEHAQRPLDFGSTGREKAAVAAGEAPDDSDVPF